MMLLHKGFSAAVMDVGRRRGEEANKRWKRCGTQQDDETEVAGEEESKRDNQ
jgi:hypothetical protein